MVAVLAPAALAPPVAIGGVGGSGTRIVAQMLRAAGIHIGDDVNGPLDTLWFTLLFKRPDILQVDDAEFDALVHILAEALAGTARFDADTADRLFALAREDRPQHTAAWLRQRALTLMQAGSNQAIDGQSGTGIPPRRWGWKEPNTHIVLDRLWQRMPEMRYVHVVRHGVDMAFSANQNQLQIWGPQVLGEPGPLTPRRSLAYWCVVHRRMQALRLANPRHMYWLDYDALCRDPAAGTAELCQFLDCDPAAMAGVLEGIHGPGTPRHAGESLAGFDPADLAFVRSLGYTVQGLD